MKFNDLPRKSAVPFADSGVKNAIPVESQVGLSPGAASFTDGFPSLTMTPLAAGGVPPNGKDFNGILNFLGSAVRWTQMGGRYSFDSSFATAIGGYPKSALMRSADGAKLWVSKTDNNTVDPDGAGGSTSWDSLVTTASIAGAYPRIFSIHALPTQDLGPIIIAECSEVWIWVNTAYYAGYRSPLCGRPVDGHTAVPLASEVDAVGGVLSKTAYGRLWGYARENSLVIDQGTWSALIGAHYFVDLGGDSFRTPDLRNMFRRYTGTSADTASTRWLGSSQGFSIQSHAHLINAASAESGGDGTGGYIPWGEKRGGGQYVAIASGDAETRPVNVAYHPRVHV